MDPLQSQFPNLNIHGQTARYERKWKDVFDQKNLLKYASKFGKKWRDVGTFLNMSQAELDNFELDNHTTSQAALSMLCTFKNSSPKYGTPAQMKELADAFESAGLMELAFDVTGFDPSQNHSPSPTTFPQQESMPPGGAQYRPPHPGTATIQQPGHSRTGSPRERIPRVLPWDDVKQFERLNKDRESVYKMTSNPRGVALVININKAAGFSERTGSSIDAELMEKLFTGLQFEVISRKDLTSDQMKTELSNFSNPQDSVMKRKIKAADCLVVFLMSHGQRDEIFTSDGLVIRCEEMVEFFQRKKSEDLYGKPVLFFIQACRGGLVDRGHIKADDATPSDNAGEEEDDYSGSFVKHMLLPETADILIAYSSVSGYKSYRNTSDGSWFVTQVSQVFSQYAKQDHVEELLTRVRKGVTESMPKPPGHSSGFCPPDKLQDQYKQCPETVSRLTKKLYLFPGM